jgi:hypothetical protein
MFLCFAYGMLCCVALRLAATVFCLVFGLQDGQLVTFNEVVGMTQLNSHKPVKVKNCRVRPARSMQHNLPSMLQCTD